MSEDDDNPKIELDGTFIAESEVGIKIETASGPRWFPKRYVSMGDDGKTFSLPTWIARERGLI